MAARPQSSPKPEQLVGQVVAATDTVRQVPSLPPPLKVTRLARSSGAVGRAMAS